MKIIKVVQGDYICYMREDLLSRFMQEEGYMLKKALCFFIVEKDSGIIIKNAISGEMLVDSFLDSKKWEIK